MKALQKKLLKISQNQFELFYAWVCTGFLGDIQVLISSTINSLFSSSSFLLQALIVPSYQSCVIPYFFSKSDANWNHQVQPGTSALELFASTGQYCIVNFQSCSILFHSDHMTQPRSCTAYGSIGGSVRRCQRAKDQYSYA